MSREEAERLAEERAARRAVRDFAAADELRDRIAGLGFEVVDRPDGHDVRPLVEGPVPSPRIRAQDVPSLLDRPPMSDWTVHWLHEGWTDDILRGIRSFETATGDRAVQHVVVESEPAAPDTWPDGVEVVALDPDPGFGASRNAGLRRSLGKLVLVVDGSVEAAGDVFGPLEEALGDPAVGACGPFCLVTDDLREFRDAEGREADAVEGYLVALRREVVEQGVAFDPRFRFYRAADIDLSFRIKDLGLRIVRVQVPVTRHQHRRWSETSPEDRDRLSKRNFYRFLDRFRGRTDLLVSGGS
jgi:Glycosyltransferase like family 2